MDNLEHDTIYKLVFWSSSTFLGEDSLSDLDDRIRKKDNLINIYITVQGQRI